MTAKSARKALRRVLCGDVCLTENGLGFSLHWDQSEGQLLCLAAEHVDIYATQFECGDGALGVTW